MNKNTKYTKPAKGPLTKTTTTPAESTPQYVPAVVTPQVKARKAKPIDPKADFARRLEVALKQVTKSATELRDVTLKAMRREHARREKVLTDLLWAAGKSPAEFARRSRSINPGQYLVSDLTRIDALRSAVLAWDDLLSEQLKAKEAAKHAERERKEAAHKAKEEAKIAKETIKREKAKAQKAAEKAKSKAKKAKKSAPKVGRAGDIPAAEFTPGELALKHAPANLKKEVKEVKPKGTKARKAPKDEVAPIAEFPFPSAP